MGVRIAAALAACALLVPSGCASGPDRGPLPPSGDGLVLYELPDRSVHLVQARPGGSAVDLSARLSATGPAALSWDGRYVAVSAADGCAAIATGDFTRVEKVTAHGDCVAAYGESLAVSDDGATLVFNGSGTHDRDLLLTRRAGPDAWSTPVNLTASGPYRFNKLPVLDAGATEVLYDCSDGDQSDEQTDICRVATSGGAVQTVLRQPIGTGADAWTAFHSPGYRPGGGYVFECHHPHEELVCVLPPGATVPVRLTASGVSNDNSPCVFADGRVASLVDTGVHTIRITRADGTSGYPLPSGGDVLDVGISCGG